MPEVVEAVNITLPAAFGSEVFNFATKAITYRLVTYSPRLKSVGPVVTQLNNGQSRLSIRLHNADLYFRSEVTGTYVTEPGETYFAGQPDKFIGSQITVRRLLLGTITGNAVGTDLIYLFGRITGATYSEGYFDLDCVTDINLAPMLSTRTVGQKCQWTYKGTECGYSGALVTCNKLYTSAGGCSGRSNQHRFGGFPLRVSVPSIGIVTGLGSPATYQVIQAGTSFQSQRVIANFDDSFGVVDDAANNRTIVTAITPDWINVGSSKYNVAASRTTTTGSITSGTATLTVASATSWKVGQGIRVYRAGLVAGTSTLNGGINATQATIQLANTTNFPQSGRALIGAEYIYYANKSNTSLLQVSRGWEGSTAASHLTGVTVTPVPDLITTVSAISGTTFTLASNAGATVSSVSVWHDDTAAFATAVVDAVTDGKPLFIPAGTYNVAPLRINGRNSLKIIGDGPGRSVLYNIQNESIIELDTVGATSHSITIEEMGFVGTGIGVGSHGIAIRDTAGNGINNVTLRNLRCDQMGGSGIFSAAGSNALFTAYLEGIDVSQPTGGSHGIDLWGSNDLTLVRCYVHAVATGNDQTGVERAAYRIRSGAPTMIGCNGIDSGTVASWGIFGNSTAEDGTDNYCRVTLIGCNIEAFTKFGVRCKSGSFANFIGSQLIAPATGTVTPIKMDYVTSDQAGIFDALSSIQSQGATYTSGYAVHSDGLPFMQVGHREFTSFYDTNGAAAATWPAITGTRLTGTQQYTHTHHGYQKLAGYWAFEEQTAPGTAPSNTGFLYAKDATGVTGLYWKADGVAEVRLDSAVALTATQVAFGASGGGVTSSSNFTWDDSAKALTVTRAGANPAIYVTDTTNTITVRLGSLAGAPDRGIVGTTTNDPFVLYANNTNGWGLSTDLHWRPYNANNGQDIGTSAAKARTGYFGTSLDVGLVSSVTGQIILYNSGSANSTTLQAGAAGSGLTFTLPTSAGSNGQVLTTNGSGVLSWSTASSGANTALSNLASVAINTSLLPDTDNSLDLGSNSFSFRDAYLDRDIYVGRRIQSLLGTAPTYTTNQGAGTSPTISINGNDVCGSIIITTGTSPAAFTTIIVLTFSTSFIRPTGYGRPILILQPGNAAAASLSGAQQIFVNESVSVGSSTQVTITSNSTALAAGTEYRWLYHVIGQGALVPGG